MNDRRGGQNGFAVSALVFVFAASACGGCHPLPPTPDGGAAAMTISPSTAQVFAGAPTLTRFDAVVQGAGGTVNWTLTPPIGTLSATSGNEVDYAPPASVSATTAVTVTASLAGTPTSASAQISVNPTPGYLNVVANNLPLTAEPDITVTGPNSYSFTLHASGELQLPAGAYTVSATGSTLGSNEAVVSGLYTASPSSQPVTIVGGQTTTAEIIYTPRGGSQMLWIGNYNSGSAPDTVAGFTEDQLVNGGFTPPVLLTPANSILYENVAFDDAGYLYASQFFGGIDVFAPYQLADAGATVPILTISGIASDGGIIFNLPCGLAIGPTGNLWVSDFNGMISELQPLSGLTGVQPAAPLIVLTNSPTSSCGLAFDSAGNLWVSSFANDTVTEFTNPSSLSGYVAPDSVVFTNDAGSTPFSGPFGIAFDSAGNLWTANFNLGVTRIDKAALANPALVSPSLTLQNFAGAGFLAFDNSGDLWVSNQFGGALYEFFDPQSLSGTLDAGPGNVVPIPPIDVGGFAFDLTPPGVPIRN